MYSKQKIDDVQNESDNAIDEADEDDEEDVHLLPDIFDVASEDKNGA